ncbi:MAG: anthranilate 1,2-dioxygenase, partial [Betaproteobacteria bacterium]|nr:anthranilate 1,2-dioxygenase [Betaproteobacteria bacterium]
MGEYAYLIDEDRLEDWVECFTDDCLYRIVPRENLDAGLP